MQPSKPKGKRRASPSDGEPAPTAIPEATPKMTALQKLALSRKAAADAKVDTAKGSSAGTKDTVTGPQPSAKPMSKLAQLAAARRTASQVPSEATAAPATEPEQVENLNAETQSTASAISEPAKPLSKLAQRVAAAKAAKAEADAKAAQGQPVTTISSGTAVVQEDHPSEPMQVDEAEAEEETSPLFTLPTSFNAGLSTKSPGLDTFAMAVEPSAKSSGQPTGPSIFFSILTARPREPLVAPHSSEAQSVTPASPAKNPFNEPSPDDLILSAREGTKFAARQ